MRVPSSVGRESTTRESSWRQNGQFIVFSFLLIALEAILGQMEEISGKPQLMGGFLTLTPTSCANRTPRL